jgi:hypothetical protein
VDDAELHDAELDRRLRDLEDEARARGPAMPMRQAGTCP